MSAPTTWSEATSVKQLTSHTYSAHFPDDWCIGSVPHGGFVTGTFLQVAKKHFSTTLSSQNQPHTITLHVDFLRRTQVGPALFVVKDAKLGRQTSVIHISLNQDGRDEVVGYITNSNMSTESGLSFPIDWKLHPSPPSVDLARLREGKDDNWVRVENSFPGFRKATSKLGMWYPREGQKRGIGEEWCRFTNGERMTNSSIAFCSDMWPMPIEPFIREFHNSPEQKGKGLTSYWFPTLLLNIDFKKSLPEEGVEFLYVRCSTKQIRNGRMDFEVVIMDEEGDIVALSHHVGLVSSAERNKAKRVTGSTSKI